MDSLDTYTRAQMLNETSTFKSQIVKFKELNDIEVELQHENSIIHSNLSDELRRLNRSVFFHITLLVIQTVLVAVAIFKLSV